MVLTCLWFRAMVFGVFMGRIHIGYCLFLVFCFGVCLFASLFVCSLLLIVCLLWFCYLLYFMFAT